MTPQHTQATPTKPIHSFPRLTPGSAAVGGVRCEGHKRRNEGEGVEREVGGGGHL